MAERIGVEQPLLKRAPERRAVRVGGAEVRIPGVQVRVDVQQRELTVAFCERAQEGQRDRVVTTDRHQPDAALEKGTRLALDGCDRLGDVEGAHRDVAGVGHLGQGERCGVQGGVLRTQHS